jgi:hypothetical protein
MSFTVFSDRVDAAPGLSLTNTEELLPSGALIVF